MVKRLSALLAMIMLILSVSAMPVAAGRDPVMAGYDDKDTYRVWGSNAFFLTRQSETGISFEYRQYDSLAAWQAAKAAMTPTGELPDVLFKAQLSPGEARQMLDDGVLIDLAPLLKDNCPHLWQAMENDPAIKASIAFADGRIAALPFINTLPTPNGLWINQTWLNHLKLEMPKTADDLYTVLKAFKTQDPNQNGRSDESPLVISGVYDLKYLSQAFGFVANDYNVSLDGNTVRFFTQNPQFENFLTFARKLYQEGLIAKDSFSAPDTLRRVTDAKATATFGAFMAPMPTGMIPLEWLPNYKLMPALSFEGQAIWRPIANPVTYGTFAITSRCEDPAKMLKWVDYLYSPEGAILATAGSEGTDYVVDGDGTWRKTDFATQQGFLAQGTLITGATAPGMANADFQMRYSDSVVRDLSEQMQALTRQHKAPFPPILLTTEQQQRVAVWQDSLARYLDESLVRFVIGEWPLDEENLDAFYQGLNDRGLTDFVSFWQDNLPAQ